VIFKKSYKNLMKNLARIYTKLMLKFNDDTKRLLRKCKILGK